MPDNVLSRMNRSEAGGVVSGPFRSVQRSGRRGVGELLDGGGDPAPGIDAIVIAGGHELVDAPVALLEHFVAIALQHQGVGAPDIDLGVSRDEYCRLAVEKGLTPTIAVSANTRVKVTADGTDIDRRGS